MVHEDSTDATEEWRPVAGYHGHYEVSTLGNVRRVRLKRGRPQYRLVGNRCLNTNGYVQTVLVATHLGLGPWSVQRHVLVAEAFLGTRPPGMCINHKNGIKTDNRLSNLEYTTVQYNLIHAYANGIARKKLCAADVRSVRFMIQDGVRQMDVSWWFGVSGETVRSIVKGETWSYV